MNYIKRLLISCILLVAVSGSLSAGYNFHRDVTINYLKVPNTDQTNYVALFSGTYTYLATEANGGNVTNVNGYDVVFMSDAGCTTLMDFQIDTYDPATGAVNFWIRLPSVSHTVGTLFYLCYGNAAITTSQENVVGVFPSSRYGAVYHFGRTAAYTGTDSTTNGQTLTGSGTTISGTLSGKIGAAATLTGTGTGALSDAGLPAANNLRTTSVWFKLATSSPTKQALFGYGRHDFLGGAWDIFYDPPSAGMMIAFGGFDQPWPWTPDTNWHRVTAVMNAANTANVQMYMDGVAMTSPNLGTVGIGTLTGGATCTLGSVLGSFFYQGWIDEIQNLSGAKSADWVMTEFNNQNDPATFYTIGAAAGNGAVNVLGVQLQGQPSVN